MAPNEEASAPKQDYGATKSDSLSVRSVVEGVEVSNHSVMGIVYIMLGAFSFSVMFLTVKIMGPDANTFTLVLYRSLVQIVLSYGTLLYTGENPLGAPEVRFWLVIRGVFGSFAVAAMFFGIQILPLPDAVTLQFTLPVFAAIFAVILAGEKWLPLDQFGAVVCFAGVAFIAHPTWLFGAGAASEESTASAFMTMMAVLVTEAGAAMGGLAYVSVRKIGDKASAVVMVLYYGVLSIPMCIICSGLMSNNWNPFILSEEFNHPMDYLILLIMGLGGYGGQFFTNLGLQQESAATATLATCTQIVWTYIFELLFLHEVITGWSLGGTALILGYMILVAVIKKVTQDKEESDTANENQPLLKEDGGEAKV